MVSSPHRPRNPGLATGAPRGARDVNVWDVPLTIQLPGLDPIGILSVGSLQVPRIPDQLEEPLRRNGGGEISGRLCTPSVCRPKAEAALRRAKLCLERNMGHREHVLGAPRQSASGHWICSQRKYNLTGFHLVPDSRLYHQYGSYSRKDASFKFVWLFWDTRYKWYVTLSSTSLNPHHWWGSFWYRCPCLKGKYLYFEIMNLGK